MKYVIFVIGTITVFLGLGIFQAADWITSASDNSTSASDNSTIYKQDTLVYRSSDGRIIRESNFDGVYIYRVDGHEYICNVRGGIIHSESCPCKEKK